MHSPRPTQINAAELNSASGIVFKVRMSCSEANAHTLFVSGPAARVLGTRRLPPRVQTRLGKIEQVTAGHPPTSTSHSSHARPRASKSSFATALERFHMTEHAMMALKKVGVTAVSECVSGQL